MIMFYITFVLICPNKPDFPYFIRSQSLELSVPYAKLKENEGMPLDGELVRGCYTQNVRLQYEVLKPVRNPKKRK